MVTMRSSGLMKLERTLRSVVLPEAVPPATRIFLRPVTQDAYYEFHVGPQNQTFQLRVPSAAAFRQPPSQRNWKLTAPVMQSWARVDVPQHRWQVMASVPFAGICESPAAMACREWLFSFSRYDYTQGNVRPCLSSTSPHAQVNFHRQEEWGRLRFEADDVASGVRSWEETQRRTQSGEKRRG